MSSSKRPKKSEMLEVRLSYEDKQNLQHKAHVDGHSVSEVVRQLISNYLNPAKSRTFPQTLMETFMRANRNLKSALAIGAVALIGALSFAPLSNAEEVGLKLKGSAVQSLKDGTRTRTFDTEILIDEGKTLILGFDGNMLSQKDIKNAKEGDLMLILSANRVDETIVLDFKIHQTMENEEGSKTELIAKPKLTAKFDEETQIILTVAENETLSLSVTPHDPKKDK